MATQITRDFLNGRTIAIVWQDGNFQNEIIGQSEHTEELINLFEGRSTVENYSDGVMTESLIVESETEDGEKFHAHLVIR